MPNAGPQRTTKGAASQIQPTRIRSKKLNDDDLLNSVGASGTYVVNGFLEQDYNSKLTGTTGLAKFDEMRKSDSQVRASLMVCMLPILSTEWYVEPAKDPETGEVGEVEQEAADFVAKALFEKMEISWHDYLTEVLTLLPFGFSLFEKVYTAEEGDEHVWLKKLAYRKQTTIDRWEQEDGTSGVTQQLPAPIADPDHKSVGKSVVSIPASKMLLFSYQKEGDNYAGVSVLRSAYKHWYIKDCLYKFDSIRHERQGVGIPVIKLPKTSTEKDRSEAKAILKNIRANEQGGVVLPNPDWEFSFADLQAGNVSDLFKSIDHHNREIAKNVLAQFLELGNTESGSRALSEDQSDFFLLALESLANLIEDVHNRFLVPELVDLNYEVRDYPKLRHKKLGSVEYASIAQTLSTLAGAGVLTPDTDLEDWIRKFIDAPPRMPEEEPEEEDIDPETGMPIDPATGLPEAPEGIEEVPTEELSPEELQALLDAQAALEDGSAPTEEITQAAETYIELKGREMGFRIVSEETKRKISESLKKRRGGGSVIEQRRNARLAKAGKKPGKKTPGSLMKKIREAMDQVGTGVAPVKTKKAKKPKKAKAHEHPDEYERIFAEGAESIARIQRGMLLEKGPIPREQVFADGNPYEAWRPLTFAEQKVNWNSLQKSVAKFQSALDSEIARITSDQKADLIAQVKRAVEGNDIAAVGKIRAKYVGELSAALTNVQKEMFELGKSSVAQEMGVKAPGTAREVMGAMKVTNDKLVAKLSSDMEAAASTAVGEVVMKRSGSITGTGTSEAVGAAMAAIDEAAKAVGKINTLALYGSLNLGRATIYERYPEKVYGFQYSAIIDDVTTDTCLSLDGKVVLAGSADFYTYAPPRHYNCRSIWVEILVDEEFKPEETGVPARIPDNPTIDQFEDMKAPVVTEGSPAIRVLEEELADREAKLKQYQESGQYPNRVASHQARIDLLKKALK